MRMPHDELAITIEEVYYFGGAYNARILVNRRPPRTRTTAATVSPTPHTVSFLIERVDRDRAPEHSLCRQAPVIPLTTYFVIQPRHMSCRASVPPSGIDPAPPSSFDKTKIIDV